MNSKGEESRPFTKNSESKTKKKNWKKKLWLESNKIIVYILFVVSVILTALSILKHYNFSFDELNDESTTFGNETIQFKNGTVAAADTEVEEDGSIKIKDIQKCIFSIVFFLISSIGISYISEKVKMPGLLGILLLGILFRNVSIINQNLLINESVASFLRKCCFLIILLRGGLGLDAKALMKLKGSCVMLAFLPCTFEAFTVGILSMLFFKIKFSFGLLLGFILATVTTAVTVPAMLELQKKTYGLDQGIPTLINAAASIDDVYAITWFSLILSSITSGSGESDESSSSTLWTIARAPIEVLAGSVLGCILGGILWIFPSSELSNLNIRRMSLLLSFSSAALFGMDYLGYDTVGPFAVLVLGFIAALRWNQQQENSKTLVEEEILKNEWKYFGLPLLFCLIGYQLDLNQLNKSSIFQSIIVLTVGLIVRCIVAVFALLKTNLNFKEKIFVSISWLPKATVQAALAPVVMDMVRTNPTKFGKYKSEATIILTVTILSILITAPAGAILIRLLGPLMLRKSKKEPFNDNENSVELADKKMDDSK
uniref:Cation/H+ exchanger domain-containing protein n=1 Tax=Panagrolaimus sp. ES5 TaxID=591445 RepID=A0AC34GXL1_9BILA